MKKEKEKTLTTQLKLRVRKRKSRSCPTSPNRQQNSPPPKWKNKAQKSLNNILAHVHSKSFVKPSQKMPKGKFFDTCVIRLENDFYATQKDFRKSVFEVVDFWLDTDFHEQACALDTVVSKEMPLKANELKSRKRKFEKAFGVKSAPRKRKKRTPPKKVMLPDSDDSEGDTEEIKPVVTAPVSSVSQVIPSSQTPEKKRKRQALDFDIDKSFSETLPGTKIEAHGLCLAGDAKPWNQDSFTFEQFQKSCTILSLFDGHGLVGHNASAHCSAYYPLLLHRELMLMADNSPESVQMAILESIQKVHKNMCFVTKNEQEMFKLFFRQPVKAVDYGTTLSNILILPGGNLYISTVGDSRVMLLKVEGNKATKFWASKDHNIQTIPKEKDRVCRAGGRIERKGYSEYRLLPDTAGKKYRTLGINMTRAVGHHILSEYGLSCTADHYHLQIDKKQTIIAVAASDGLWDVTKNEQVVQITNQFLKKGCETIANELIKQARANWKRLSPKCDDTTIVVCKLTAT